jgi:hypothetical protein
MKSRDTQQVKAKGSVLSWMLERALGSVCSAIHISDLGTGKMVVLFMEKGT